MQVCKYLQSTVTKFSASATVVADAEVHHIAMIISKCQFSMVAIGVSGDQNLYSLNKNAKHQCIINNTCIHNTCIYILYIISIYIYICICIYYIHIYIYVYHMYHMYNIMDVAGCCWNIHVTSAARKPNAPWRPSLRRLRLFGPDLGTMGKSGVLWIFYGYPLVVEHSYWKWPFYSGFTHWKWWLSIVTLVYQRIFYRFYGKFEGKLFKEPMTTTALVETIDL